MKGLEIVIAAAGILMLGYWAVIYSSAGVYQAREIRRFGSNSSRTAARARVPSGKAVHSVPKPGSLIAKIEIPRIGVSAVVVEGTDERALRFAPGHIRETPLPGEGGNVGMAGHRDTFFRPLRFVRKGDEIQMTTPVRQLHYRVVSMEIVAPTEVRVLDPTEQETLTLITCYPFYFIGAAPMRFVVRAECDNCTLQAGRESKTER